MEFQSYLSQKYQGHESFLENIIFPIFGEDNYESSYDIELLDSEELRGQAARTGIRSIIRCGTIDLDLTPIEVFDITVSDRILMDKNRVGVQAVIHRVMDTYSGAFMIFHYDNDVKWDWRFTFCQMKDKGEFTDNKRYTFLLGPNQSCRTAAQNFQKLADLHENISIKDIVAAFDVEALSKAFFDGYKRHYERFVEFITGKRFVKEGGKFVEKTSHDPHPEYYPAFGSDDKAVRDYTKLLLARIVFLHFLQKKGWLGVPKGGKWGDGDEQFMKHLYERSSEEQKEDFLESVLEPLFFDALNGDRSSSKDVFDTKVVGEVRVPYLNGGLFSKDALDDVVIRYPKEFFGDFLEFLYQYNFTIDENDPNDAQVGIDPEMLGKIFENLLEDNKDKGAFYTPKEIVQYMCQESLIACLETKTGLGEDRLRGFVKDPFVRVSEFTPDEQYAILGAILNVKICDPAIGSGAFPIGLLNELVRCKEAIYGDEKGRAEIKKEIIRDNIYGVDIEKGAVDIARLRFWLSLIVDEEKPLPLPNLDYKIMQGNSLLEWYDGVDLSHLSDTAVYGDMFGGGRAEDLKRDLSMLLKQYFGESDHKKKNNLKVRITETIKDILEIAAVVIPEDIDVAENSQFFLWHTWFNDVFVEGGFDIVIGNPPYIQLQSALGIKGKNIKGKIVDLKLGDLYEGQGYSTFTRMGDIYCLFYEQGFNMLQNGGHLCYITSNKWLKADYGTGTRSFFTGNGNTKLLIDFNKVQIFETAQVDTCILLVSREKYSGQTFSVKADDNCKESLFSLDEYVKTHGIISVFDNERSWVIRTEIENQIKNKISIGKPFFSYGLQLNRGLLSGLNEAFIINTETKNSILSNCLSEQERIRTESLIHPMLRGKDVETYSYSWGGQWIIWIPWHFPHHLDSSLKGVSIESELQFKADYNALYEYLLPFKEKLLARNDAGRLYDWYALQRWGADFWEELNKPKIIYREISPRMDAVLVSNKWYLNNKLYFITGDNLEYFIAILNSTVFNKIVLAEANLTGGKGYDFMSSVLIPEPTEEYIKRIKALFVDGVPSNYDELDEIVFDMYGLSSEEVDYLKSL